eukprot:scaffold191391_cov13-Tisochrysis_lutea.AAC.1
MQGATGNDGAVELLLTSGQGWDVAAVVRVRTIHTSGSCLALLILMLNIDGSSFGMSPVLFCSMVRGER